LNCSRKLPSLWKLFDKDGFSNILTDGVETLEEEDVKVSDVLGFPLKPLKVQTKK